MFYAKAQVGTNTCAGSSKGGCEHLCLARSGTEHICSCAIGYRVNPNNHSRCIGIEEFLFYTDQELKGIEIYDPLKPIGQQGQEMVRKNINNFCFKTIFMC